MEVPKSICLAGGADSVRIIKLAEGADGKKLRRFSMVAYTGGVVESWFGRLILDFKGAKIGRKKKPILKDHISDKIVGYSDTIELISDGPLTIEGNLSSATPAGREVAQLADEGFPWQASVGVTFTKVLRVGEDETVQVNGKAHKGPLLVASDWKLKEASFTPLGADENTSAAALSGTDDGVLSVEVEKTEMDKETKATKDADPVATFADAHPEAVEAWKREATEETVKAERARFSELHKAFGERPGFVCEQYTKGHSVLEARAALSDVLTAELKEAREHAVKMREQLDAANDGADGVGFSSADDPAKPDETKLGVEELAKLHWERDEAQCRDRFPDLKTYTRYLARVRRDEEAAKERGR